MRRTSALGWFAAMALLPGGMIGSARAGGPTFDLTFQGCVDVEGEPGAAISGDISCVLATGGLAGSDGAQGWSISLAATGAGAISGITTVGTAADAAPAGLRDGGFEKSELTTLSRAGSECDGRNGAVSAVVLSFTLPIVLPASSSPSAIAKVTVSGTAPAEGQCNAAGVVYADGCRGSGQPVDNRITWLGNTVLPSKGRCDFNFCGAVPPPVCPNPAADLQVILQTSNTNHVAGDPFATGNPPGLAPTPDPLLPAQIELAPGEGTVYAAIVSKLGGQGVGGVQGWSLSVSVMGGIGLVGVTTAGTAAATEPTGLSSGGFNKTQLVDPDLNAQGVGAVSAVVLSFTLTITLAEDSTATVLCMTLSGEEGASGQVKWLDGLQGSGQPVRNVATVAGNTRNFACCQTGDVRFVKPPVSDFKRCDPNNDGKNNIADAVWIVQELFYAGPPTTCPDAADCNDDEMEDLADAAYALAYQFLGGTQPPAPFPDCGTDDDSTPESCPAGSTLCP